MTPRETWSNAIPEERPALLARLIRGLRLVPVAVAVVFLLPPFGRSAVVDLTKGAATIVPASMNPGFVDAFGQPYEVRTRVTAVRFHTGSTPSTAPGGLTATPNPVLKKQHGVSYYQVTGELSGIGHSPIGVEYVYGPIDANGLDRSGHTLSPRFGLRGIPFRLIYPADWNGHLIVYRNGGDGGRGSGHYLYQAITDELALVDRGFAYFVTLGGGTTPFDSNPDSTSGLFWKLAPPFWAPSGPEQPAYFRAASIGPGWSEGVIPDSQPGIAWFPDEPDPLPTPIGSSAFVADPRISTQDDVPTFRDHINVAKNLLRLLTGVRPTVTGVVAWSRSGNLATGMDFGRTAQWPPSVIAPVGDPQLARALTPRTGGDYNTPYVPSSGRIVDWFVVRSGLQGTTAPQPPDGHPDFLNLLPDPEYPIAAPFIYVSAEVDISDAQLIGYYWANALAAALPGSKLANKDINAWLRLYSLHGATHQPREVWFAGPYNGVNTTWYDYGGAGFNSNRQGLELAAWMDAVRANNPDLLGNQPFGLDPIALFAANSLSEEGFELQTILNADRWASRGTAPPTSVVDHNLVGSPSTSTRTPSYPVARACKPGAIFVALRLKCLRSLKRDSVINDPNAGFHRLYPDEVELLEQFATGPLRFTTNPIDLPGEAAPLGYRLFTSGPVLLRPFKRQELKHRYHTHDGYVAAVARAVDDLVARQLYDSTIGAMDVTAAQQSSVLR